MSLVEQRKPLISTHWLLRLDFALKAIGYMLAGAGVLAVVEKMRRGAFTNDDIVTLLIVWIVVGLVERGLRRELEKRDAFGG